MQTPPNHERRTWTLWGYKQVELKLRVAAQSDILCRKKQVLTPIEGNPEGHMMNKRLAEQAIQSHIPLFKSLALYWRATWNGSSREAVFPRPSNRAFDFGFNGRTTAFVGAPLWASSLALYSGGRLRVGLYRRLG